MFLGKLLLDNLLHPNLFLVYSLFSIWCCVSYYSKLKVANEDRGKRKNCLESLLCPVKNAHRKALELVLVEDPDGIYKYL